MRTNEEYKNLEAERDALAARVAEMREALKKTHFALRFWIDCAPIERRITNNAAEDVERVSNVLAAPDDSAAILARRDADIWRQAAFMCMQEACGGSAFNSAVKYLCDRMSDRADKIEHQTRAAELEKAHANYE